MLLSEDEVKETIEMMNNGEISVAEAWEILDYFDGDLIEFLQLATPKGVRTCYQLVINFFKNTKKKAL